MKKIGRIVILTVILALLTSCCLAEAKLVDTMKSGKLARQTWTDENGNTINGPDGYAYTVYTYTKGQVKERWYTADDQPFRKKGGYCGQAITRGLKNRIEEIVYLDENGNPTLSDNGYARITMAYTSKGDVTRVAYYDTRNRSVMNTGLGWAVMENSYRGRTLTRTEYLDENKRPVDIPAGYAVKSVSVTKKNNIRGISYEHANGSPAACEEGWSSCEITLDKQEREIARKYYDTNGSLMEIREGLAWEETVYESDDIYTVTGYDLSGNPVECPEGYAGLRVEKNSEGRIVRESYLDGNGNRVTDARGVAASRFTYDREGRLIKVLYEDLNGNITLNSEGIAGYEDTLDADGVLISRVNLGVDGMPMQ